MSEKTIQTEIMLALSRQGAVVFRNNQGNGVCGKIKDLGGGVFHVTGGRRVQYGIGQPGGSDIIGWFHGRFLAVEVKSPSGDLTDAQANFIKQVRAHGGLAGVARSVDEAVMLLERNLL